jgi:hypothetical protein
MIDTVSFAKLGISIVTARKMSSGNFKKNTQIAFMQCDASAELIGDKKETSIITVPLFLDRIDCAEIQP